jgi:glycosyltransferase involved in cell wall biosynthesis
MSLVSVIISTYNSSSYIKETLNSVSNQTWQELELIITDDCSGDDTVEVCNNWLIENKQRFFKTELLTSNVNTGVSANANRGLYTANGDWIKFLGADDTLKPDCIKENMLWITSNPEIRTLFSRVEIYNNSFRPDALIATTQDDSSDPRSIMSPGRSADSQYKMLLLSDRIHYTPSVFLHRVTLISVGGFDERFKLIEDYPLWINLTKYGYKLYFMNKVTVNYRMHSKAINNTGNSYLVNPNYFKLEDFRRIYTYPFLPADIRLHQRYVWYASQVFRYDWLNKKGRLNKFLHDILILYLNPFKYLVWLKPRIIKCLHGNEFYM